MTLGNSSTPNTHPPCGQNAGQLPKFLGKKNLLKYHDIANSSFIYIYSFAITVAMRAQIVAG